MTIDSDRVEGYASALFDVARGEDLLDRVSDELFTFVRTFEHNDDLRQTLTDQAIPVEARQGIVEDLLGKKASPLSASLVSFIIGSGRGRDLIPIVDRFIERAATERQTELAEVRSSMPLNADLQGRLAKALSSALGKKVDVKVVVDPSVMGGVIARVGDTVIDGSIRYRLEKLREVL